MLRIDLTGWALLMIAMAVGYLICLKASKESTKLYKLSGVVIGLIIIITSLALVVTTIINNVKTGSARARTRRAASTRMAPTVRPRLPQVPSGRNVPTRIPTIPELPKAPTMPTATTPPSE